MGCWPLRLSVKYLKRRIACPRGAFCFTIRIFAFTVSHQNALCVPLGPIFLSGKTFEKEIFEKENVYVCPHALFTWSAFVDTSRYFFRQYQRYGAKPLAAQWITSTKCIWLCMDELHRAPLTTDILSGRQRRLTFSLMSGMCSFLMCILSNEQSAKQS